MDNELRAYLEGMEQRLREYTDQRSTMIETRMREYTDQLETRMREHTDQLETRMREYTDQRSEMIETRLLRAFRNYAHPVEARMRVQRVATRAINERLDALEDRVEFLEHGSDRDDVS